MGAVAFLIGSNIFLPGGPEGKGEVITVVPVYGLTRAFIIWCWFGTYYEINGNQLRGDGSRFNGKLIL
ncbi:hypothetical protein [Bacillus salipaludis]|uniref:Uncharacterized protein n=1 Tax=Bacillus salipaludis TaxID=2547811 RepID=A0ABW8RJR4_9BACI